MSLDRHISYVTMTVIVSWKVHVHYLMLLQIMNSSAYWESCFFCNKIWLSFKSWFFCMAVFSVEDFRHKICMNCSLWISHFSECQHCLGFILLIYSIIAISCLFFNIHLYLCMLVTVYWLTSTITFVVCYLYAFFSTLSHIHSINCFSIHLDAN